MKYKFYKFLFAVIIYGTAIALGVAYGFVLFGDFFSSPVK
jgi:hypothetical protein